MDIIALIKYAAVLIVGFFNIFLAFVVLMRNPKDVINKVFFVIGVFFAAWCFSLFLYEYTFIFSSLFWIKTTYLMVVIFISASLIFSAVFPTSNFKQIRFLVIGLIVSYAATSIWLLYFTNLFVAGVIELIFMGTKETILGPAYIWWTLFTWILLITMSVNLIIKGKKADRMQKLQMRYYWLGFCTFGAAVCIPDVLIPMVWGTTRYFYISVLCNVFFSGSVAYIILKHRFLDIRWVIARVIAYALLLAVLGSFYGLVIAYVGGLIFQKSLGANYYAFLAVLTLFAAITFQPIRQFFERTTDKFLYKGNYNSDDLLRTISSAMVGALTLHELVSAVSSVLRIDLHASHVTFITRKEGEILDPDQSYGKTNLTHGDLLKMETQEQMLVFEEQPEGVLKQIMRDHDITVFIPLRNRDTFIGSVLLGPKSSGDIYFDKDLKILTIISSELAVAIENAQRHEEIKNFNIRLTDEVKRATQDLLKANNRLQDLDKLKDEFVSVASHELRSPMTVIQGYVWRVLTDKESVISDKNKDRLDRAYNSTRRLIALVNDILDVSRIEAGRMQFTPVDFDIVGLAREVKEEMEVKSLEKKITITFDDSSSHHVWADRDKTHQVLLNLLDNAVKFTPVQGTITIGFTENNGVTVASVKDNGIGIKAEDMSKLFTKFGKLDNSLSLGTKYIGTGLGLYLSKKIIESMKGSMNAVSEWGKGTAFMFALPKPPTHSA